MSRELKRDLFADFLPPNPQGNSAKIDSSKNQTSTRLIGVDEWQVLSSQLDLLKRRQKELEARQESFQQTVSQWMETTKGRFERFNSAGSRMEQFLKQTIHEINEKFAHLGGRVAERRLQETKIQEMMDRHNQVLQTYEVRLSQIQKLVQEQEIQLMGARASLEEARREIARLKKV